MGGKGGWCGEEGYGKFSDLVPSADVYKQARSGKQEAKKTERKPMATVTSEAKKACDSQVFGVLCVMQKQQKRLTDGLMGKMWFD